MACKNMVFVVIIQAFFCVFLVEQDVILEDLFLYCIVDHPQKQGWTLVRT